MGDADHQPAAEAPADQSGGGGGGERGGVRIYIGGLPRVPPFIPVRG